jgi:hypothetical protein
MLLLAKRFWSVSGKDYFLFFFLHVYRFIFLLFKTFDVIMNHAMCSGINFYEYWLLIIINVLCQLSTVELFFQYIQSSRYTSWHYYHRLKGFRQLNWHPSEPASPGHRWGWSRRNTGYIHYGERVYTNQFSVHNLQPLLFSNPCSPQVSLPQIKVLIFVLFTDSLLFNMMQNKLLYTVLCLLFIK